ncbi:hypothetical protein NDU88_004881 [Pleurodeles waltl]|uniref:Uncharacterized protein n=1 Tax=Pleurodeles waltl TaxID=8319 RepID=A0AAV7KZM5_PLEWA|nr:hypothetical protein NDU88_004881 [Pleurodeles waltl]
MEGRVDIMRVRQSLKNPEEDRDTGGDEDDGKDRDTGGKEEEEDVNEREEASEKPGDSGRRQDQTGPKHESLGAAKRKGERREASHIPGGTWLFQTDVPATVRTESGTESRFSLHGDALPGRHGNVDTTSITGNPDIRVPDAVKIEDGLRSGGGGRRRESRENAERRIWEDRRNIE